jgi:ubiquinone/menaquinone biosynthesis C-methylase UbiE
MKTCGNRKPQYTVPLPARLVDFLKDKTAKNVLDVGCGYGRACFFLHENGYDVIGVDVDKTQIRIASEEAKTQGINGKMSFIVDDARNLCFPDSSFDAVTMLGLLTLVPKSKRTQIVNEAYRVLKPSGYLFVEEFGQTWTNAVYAKRYREDVKVTGERCTITVKDETGKIVHFAHHFTRGELGTLLRSFNIVSFEEDTFTSYYHRNWVKGYVILAQKQIT